MLKKILLTIICFSLIACVNVNAEDKVEKMSKANETLLQKLTALGIVGGYDDNFGMDEEVTRADFATIMIRMIGYGVDNVLPKPTEAVYKDVSADYWASAEIKLSTEMGLFNGYKDGKFYPDETVEYNEVIKSIVSLLGYDVMAQIKGGYPTGYLAKAAELGITKNIFPSKHPNREIILNIISNSLEANVFEQTSFGDTDKYEMYKNETILSKYRKIFYSKGIVTATSVTTLTSGTYNLPNKNEVTIDNIRFSVGYTSVDLYLGQNIEFYYEFDKENQVGVLKYIAPISTRNRIMKIENEDIVPYSQDTELSTYEYYNENDKKMSVKLSDDLCVIYNGIARPNYSLAEIRPAYGNVTLIDNNSDGIYDVLSVFRVTAVCIVDSVGKNDDGYIIADKRNKTSVISLKNDNGEDRFTIVKDGTKSFVNGITEFDVLLVGKNVEFDYTYVYATSAHSVTGRVESFSADDGAKIGDKSYKVSDSYTQMSQTGLLAKIESGISGTFYLDLFDRIQYYQKDKLDGFKYAIFLDATLDPGLHTTGKMKLYDENGSIKTFNLPEKLRFNDNKENAEDCITRLKAVNPNDGGRPSDPTYIRQLIQYKVEKGAISDIHTVKKNIGDSFDENIPLSYSGKVAPIDGQYVWYDYALNGGNLGMCVANKYYVSKNTKIFDVYPNELDITVKIGSIPTVSVNSNLNFYNLQENKIAGVIVRYFTSESTKAIVPMTKPCMIVKSISEAVDSDGNVRPCINGYENGKMVKVFYDSDIKQYISEAISSLKSGDIILYEISTGGRLDSLAKIFDSTRGDEYGVIPAGASMLNAVHGARDFTNQQNERRLIYGVVVKRVGDYILYNLGSNDANGTLVQSVIGYTSNVYEINNTSNTVKINSNLTLKDIKPGDKIFMVVSPFKVSNIWVMNY